MPFDMVKAMSMPQAKSSMFVPKRAVSNSRALAGPVTSYSAEAVPSGTLDSSGPENASQEPRALSEFEYTQELNKRIDARTAERNAAAKNAPRGAARRIAVLNGEAVYTPVWKDKTKQLDEDELQHYNMLRSTGRVDTADRVFEYTKHSDEYKRNLAEWEMLKQERPWHAQKWPMLMTATGKSISWTSMADPNYRDTETKFLEYAQVYLAAGLKQYREILPVWIAGAKEVLGILEIKEKQEAVRTEILIEGRKSGMQSMQAMAATRKKNCSGTELTELCQVVLTQPLGLFALSTKQMQTAESRGLLQYPMPMHDELQYCAINWLLYDMPRYTAFKELQRSLGRGNRSYIDDMGVQRLLATGKAYKGMPESITDKE